MLVLGVISKQPTIEFIGDSEQILVDGIPVGAGDNVILEQFILEGKQIV